MQSIFIIEGSSGDVVMEKHYRGVTSRASVEVFWEAVAKLPKRDDVPPIIPTTKYNLVSIYRGGLYFLATVVGEAPPLFVLEFLHRVYDVFVDYYGEVSPRNLTDNFSTSYQLLEEMLDNGYPCITEPNALTTLIAPPSIASRLTNFVVGKASNVSETLGEGAMSIIPWRRAGAKYASNEIYFDIVEEIDMIVESNGTVVASDVRGTVTVNCRLSGTPDLTLIFAQPSVIEDCAFHPCVRYARWERDSVVSFVPPDGSFVLMSYRATDRSPQVPIYCRPMVTWREGAARASFVLGAKPIASRTSGVGGGMGGAVVSTDAMSIEDVAVRLSFPKCIKSIDLSSDVGTVHADPKGSELVWHMSRMPKDRAPELAGNVYLEAGAQAPVESLTGTLHFVVPNTTVSGLAVRDLVLSNETYKFFKGVKTVMRAGRIQIRT